MTPSTRHLSWLKASNARTHNRIPPAGGALSLVAPLSASDVRDQQDAFTAALARLEAAALGLPPAQLPLSAAVDGAAGRAAAVVGGLLVAPGGGRQERAQRWAQGALARALEERQRRIMCGAARRARGGWAEVSALRLICGLCRRQGWPLHV